MYIPAFDDVIAADDRIRPYIHRTPVLISCYLNDLTGVGLQDLAGAGVAMRRALERGLGIEAEV